MDAQTDAGQRERYITPELKEYEEQITGAEEKIMALELDLYEKLLSFLQGSIAPSKPTVTSCDTRLPALFRRQCAVI